VKTQANSTKAWGFLIRFSIFVLLSYALLAIPAVDRQLYFVLMATASASAPLITLLGYPCSVDGVILRSSEFSVAVRRGCDGVEPTLVLWSAMLALRAPLIPTLSGLLASAMLIQLLNFLRVISLFVIGVRWPSAFHVMHVEVWPVFLIIIGMAFFIPWMNWSLRYHVR
jgi:exosortase/archaeosortase family protein